MAVVPLIASIIRVVVVILAVAGLVAFLVTEVGCCLQTCGVAKVLCHSISALMTLYMALSMTLYLARMLTTCHMVVLVIKLPPIAIGLHRSSVMLHWVGLGLVSNL